jgi:non-ribosomal peptide synthetase component F
VACRAWGNDPRAFSKAQHRPEGDPTREIVVYARAARSRYEAGMTTASRHSAPTDVTGGRTTAFAPPERTLPTMLLRQAERHGERRLLRVGPLHLTFAGAPGLAARAAGMLAAAGIRRGDRVALKMTNRSEFIEIWPGRIVGGRILCKARDGGTVDLAQTPERRMRAIRGREIAMIFQEPMTSLNPLFTIGGFLRPQDASTTTRTSSRAACAGGR